jgi:acetyltransferase-like isoleucine patch superfamily enzyme
VLERVRNLLKLLFNGMAMILVSPAVAMCWMEKRRGASYSRVFSGWCQFFAVLPGLGGMVLRRAFYHGTLRQCSWDCVIGFGTMFNHREATVEPHVYVGSYALLGSVHLETGALIGSRVSVLSKGNQHELDDQGRWVTPPDRRLRPTSIGPYAWIGEAAVIMADVGRGSMVAAGSVVSATVPAGILVAGNPARFVRRLGSSVQDESEPGDSTGSATLTANDSTIP